MTVNRKTKLFTVAILLALVVPTVLSIAPAWACGGCDCPCTGTPGYWKNHPEAWPVEEITIGGVTYTRDGEYGAIWWLNQPVKGDKSITMFKALVAAKLNGLSGCDDSCIAGTIVDADLWMMEWPGGWDCGPVGSGVEARSECWQYSHGEALYWALDAYNNGLLWCAAARH